MIFDNEEDIEILDLDEAVIKVEKKVITEEVEVNNNFDKRENNDIKKVINKKEKKKLSTIFQIVFCSISLIFIIGCCIFYGSRLFKYYRIYNPKPSSGEKISLLANEITSKSEIVYENDGLYISGGNYIYKGNVLNNYLRYNNMLWRIVKINKDDTIDIILDDYINVLSGDSKNIDYIKSDIYNYLNDYFLNNINKSLLSPLSICTDKFDKLNELSCNNKEDNGYVSLLDVSNFLNSVVDGNSYLVSNDEIFWLSNQGSEKVWHTNGVNVSMSKSDSFYEVRPLVTLKAAVVLYGGDGSKDNPYIIEKNENKLSVGSYVKLDEDLWIVYNKDKNIHLTLGKTLENQYHFSSKETDFDMEIKNSLAEYLNTTYLDSLSYKDILIEEEWNNGLFKGSYKDVIDKKVKSMVSIPSVMDLKFNSDISNYLLMTANDDGLVYTYGEIVKTGKPSIYRNIRPCISISDKTNIKSGSGSYSDPFVLEV